MEHDVDAPLMPARERTVEFYGDQVPAAQLADGTIMVPLRPIVEALGLDWPSQTNRLKRDARLRSAQGVVVMTTPGGRQTMTALPLRLLPGWMFKIDTARVRPELRAKIERYQEEAYEALWQAFKGDILPAAHAGPDLAGVDLAVEQARAVLRLAEQQQAAEQALARHEQTLAEQGGALTRISDKQEAMAGYLRPFVQDTRQRLTALELQLSAGATMRRRRPSSPSPSRTWGSASPRPGTRPAIRRSTGNCTGARGSAVTRVCPPRAMRRSWPGSGPGMRRSGATMPALKQADRGNRPRISARRYGIAKAICPRRVVVYCAQAVRMLH
jgi:hypothetical protein